MIPKTQRHMDCITIPRIECKMGFYESAKLILCIIFFLTTCVSVESCERQFLKLIKTKNLCSTMRKNRLTSLAIVTVDHKQVKKTKFDIIVGIFTQGIKTDTVMLLYKCRYKLFSFLSKHINVIKNVKPFLLGNCYRHEYRHFHRKNLTISLLAIILFIHFMIIIVDHFVTERREVFRMPCLNVLNELCSSLSAAERPRLSQGRCSRPQI